MDYLAIAKELGANEISEEFVRAWEQVVEESPPEFNVLVWGSTIRDAVETPTDLDVIIEYYGDAIGSSKEESLEGIIESRVIVDEFAYLDVWVAQYERTPNIIANSRVSRVYNASQGTWEEFE